MSWKSFACVAALSALIVSPALAQPSLSVVDAGLNGMNRIFEVYITPETDGNSVATELGFSITGASVVGTTTNSTAGAFDEDNPGNNPFSGTQTSGVVIAGSGTDIFASLGSGALTGSTLAFSFEVDAMIALVDVLGDFTGNGRIAEDGVNNDIYTGTFGINGDFDVNGAVTGADFSVFGAAFGGPGPVGDFDGNGSVTGADFSVFGANFGKAIPASATAAAVPEPTSLIMLGGFAIAGLATRRRV